MERCLSVEVLTILMRREQFLELRSSRYVPIPACWRGLCRSNILSQTRRHGCWQPSREYCLLKIFRKASSLRYVAVMACDFGVRRAQRSEEVYRPLPLGWHVS